MISFGQPFASAPGTSPVSIAFERHHDGRRGGRQRRSLRTVPISWSCRATRPNGPRLDPPRPQAAAFRSSSISTTICSPFPRASGEAKFKAYNSPERLQALRDNIERQRPSVRFDGRARPQHSRSTASRRRSSPGDIYCSVSPDQVGALVAPAAGPVIGYMGTGGHSADLAMIMPAICEVMDAVPSAAVRSFRDDQDAARS